MLSNDASSATLTSSFFSAAANRSSKLSRICASSSVWPASACFAPRKSGGSSSSERRCSRAFPAWTLLAAATSYNLKEAAESGKLYTESTYKALSSGLAGMGALYLLAKGGAIFIDPSFPVHYGIVRQVFPLQAAAATAMSLTLRPDTK